MPDDFDEIERRFGVAQPDEFDRIEARFSDGGPSREATDAALLRHFDQQMAGTDLARGGEFKAPPMVPVTDDAGRVVRRVPETDVPLAPGHVPADEHVGRVLAEEEAKRVAAAEDRYQSNKTRAHVTRYAQALTEPVVTLARKLTGQSGAPEQGSVQARIDEDTARSRRDLGMWGRVGEAGVATVIPAVAMGGASKALTGAGVPAVVASPAAMAGVGALTSPPGQELESAATLATLGVLGSAFSRKIAEYVPRLPLNLRAIASEGGGNVLAGAVLGQTSPDEITTNLVLGAVMRAVDSRPDVTEADLRREAIQAVQAQRKVNAGVRAEVSLETAMGDVVERGQRSAEAFRSDFDAAAADQQAVQDRVAFDQRRQEARPALPQGALRQPAAPEPKAWKAAVEAFQDVRGGLHAARLWARSRFSGQNMAELKRTALAVGVEPGKSKRETVDRLTRAAEERMPPRLTAEDAGAVKAKAVELGLARPEEVYSPERTEWADGLARAGATPEQIEVALERLPPETRPDGTIAAGYRPSGEALEAGIIEPAAIPAVEQARAQGIEPVTSGTTPDGRGFAVGVDGKGIIRRVETPSPRSVNAVERESAGRTLSQFVRQQGGFDYARESESGRLVRELDSLRRKESGTTGLVRVDGRGGRSVEDMMQSARESGYDVPRDMRPGDFLELVRADAGRSERVLSPQDTDFEALADAEMRRRDTSDPDRVEEAEAVLRALDAFDEASERSGIQGDFGDADASFDFSLDSALKRYGPQPEEGGTTLGALGGVKKATFGKALDAPRDLLRGVGSLVDRGVAALPLDRLGTLVGRGVRKIPGVSRVVDSWKARRGAQSVFADERAELEARGLESEGAQRLVAKATDTPEKQAAVQAFIESPNDTVKAAKAKQAVGNDGFRAVSDALDKRDANQRYIEENRLVGAEARRVYEAAPGKRGTYLRREYQGVEDEVYDHLLLLQGKGARLPKNELKRDKWIVTWGKDSYRKFETEAEAKAFRQSLRTDAREQVEAKKDQAKRGQPVAGEPGSNAEIIAPLSPEARKQMGEVTDPAVVLARTLAVQSFKIARHKTLQAFARNSLPGDSQSVPERFTRRGEGGERGPATIPDEPHRYGPLAGRTVDRVVYDEVVGKYGPVDKIDKIFDVSERLTSLWKAGKTIYNPGSQAGNVIGNIAFLERGGISLARPTDYAYLRDAVRVALARPGTPEYALRVELARRGMGGSSSIDADLQGSLRAVSETRGQSSRSLLLRVGRAIKNGPKATWELADTIPKMAAALKVLRVGGTLDDATRVVRESFPDYSRSWAGVMLNSRTRAARLFRTTMSPPFMNFLSESVRIGAQTAAKKPGSLALGLATLGMLAKLSKDAAGITDEEERKILAAAPDWMRAGSLAAPLFWDRDEDGNPMVADLRYVLPLSKELGDAFGTGDARQSGISIINNPILAPLVDLTTGESGTDRFFGEPLSKPGASDEEKREQRLRYLFDAWAPSVLTKVTPFGRRPSTTYQAATGKADRYGDTPDLGRAVLGDFAGVRLRPVDVEKEMKKHKIAAMARVNEKMSALRAARKRGDEAEVARIRRDILAIRDEYVRRKEAASR